MSAMKRLFQLMSDKKASDIFLSVGAPINIKINGNAVPVTITVESPMSATDHVRAIHLFTEKNPQPRVIGAQLGPRAGRAQLRSPDGIVPATTTEPDGTRP